MSMVLSPTTFLFLSITLPPSLLKLPPPRSLVVPRLFHDHYTHVLSITMDLSLSPSIVLAAVIHHRSEIRGQWKETVEGSTGEYVLHLPEERWYRVTKMKNHESVPGSCLSRSSVVYDHHFTSGRKRKVTLSRILHRIKNFIVERSLLPVYELTCGFRLVKLEMAYF